MRKILRRVPGRCQNIDIDGEIRMKLVSACMCSRLIHLNHLDHYHLNIVPHHNMLGHGHLSQKLKKNTPIHPE